MNSSVCSTDQHIESEKHDCSPSPRTFSSLKFTLKAWPMIALATIGLCFLTKLVSGWFGVELPDQNQVEVVRAQLLHAFDSVKCFLASSIMVAEIVLIAPLLEETIFRLPCRSFKKHTKLFLVAAIILSALFSAAHYPDYAHFIYTGVFRWLPLNDAFLALFFFGMGQCWLYRKTNIWCAMLNHALFNLTNLLLLFVVPA